MVNSLFIVLMHLLFWPALVWLVLALLSAKWPSWKTVRKGYTGLLRAGGAGIARFLWAPGLEREGGGQMAQIRIPYKERDGTWG